MQLSSYRRTALSSDTISEPHKMNAYISRVVLLLAAAACASAAALELSILHLNDHHSHLEATELKTAVAGYGDVTVHAGGFPNAVALAKQLVTSEEAAGRSAGGVFYDSDSTRQPKLNALLKQQQGGYVFKLSRC